MSKALGRIGIAMLVLAGLGLSACSTLKKTTSIASGFVRPSTRADVQKSASSCVDFSVSIYFAFDVYSLTRENRAVLNTAADQTQGCRLNSVNVVGLSDPVGSPDYNLALSEKRADAVREALAAVGLGNVTFDAAGAEGALKSSGQIDPLRRRADVLISLSPMP